jgi:hypothetical protein
MLEVPKSHLTLNVYNTELGLGVPKSEPTTGLSAVTIALIIGVSVVALLVLLYVATRATAPKKSLA